MLAVFTFAAFAAKVRTKPNRLTTGWEGAAIFRLGAVGVEVTQGHRLSDGDALSRRLRTFEATRWLIYVAHDSVDARHSTNDF